MTDFLHDNPLQEMGVRRFGRVNWLGLGTLCRREVLRFMKVYLQTIAAPVAIACLFLTVFTLAIGARRGDVLGLPFDQFLAPGVVMMTVLQNAFANTSSSMGVAKVQGNIIDTLTPPLSPAEIGVGFLAGGLARGVAVGALGSIVVFSWTGLGVAAPLWALFFLLAAAAMLALAGLAAAIWAEKFDHIAAITNFLITPLSFLSGTFYSVSGLPPAWEAVSRFNPFFYLIDGFRYGVTGAGDADPWLGAAVSMGGGRIALAAVLAHAEHGLQAKALIFSRSPRGGSHEGAFARNRGGGVRKFDRRFAAGHALYVSAITGGAGVAHDP